MSSLALALSLFQGKKLKALLFQEQLKKLGILTEETDRDHDNKVLSV